MRAARFAGRCFAALAFGLCHALAANAQPYDPGGTEVGWLDADGAPVYARFAPASGPLARQTAQPQAWYAVLQWPMAPGQAYRLQLNTPDDGGRLRLSAFDDDPYANPTVRADIALRLAGPRVRRRANWGATVRIPEQARQAGVWLLLEWMAPVRVTGAPLVRVQAYAVDPATLAAHAPRWDMNSPRADIPASPLSAPSVVQELPLPLLTDPAGP